MNEHFNPIKIAIDQILNVDSSIKRRKHTKQQQSKELFIDAISSLQRVINRSEIAFADLNIDYSTYDESFFQIIDKLMMLLLGEKAYLIVSFYLWERTNPDGTQNIINDSQGNVIPLDNPHDLWSEVVKLNPKLEK